MRRWLTGEEHGPNREPTLSRKILKVPKASSSKWMLLLLLSPPTLLSSLQIFFLLVKDKSRVGGRNCGGAEFASAMITQKNTDDQNKDTNSVQLKVTKGQELYPSTYADIEGNEQLYNLNSCLSFWQ